MFCVRCGLGCGSLVQRSADVLVRPRLPLGQVDLTLRPDNENQIVFLNYTKLADVLAASPSPEQVRVHVASHTAATVASQPWPTGTRAVLVRGAATGNRRHRPSAVNVPGAFVLHRVAVEPRDVFSFGVHPSQTDDMSDDDSATYGSTNYSYSAVRRRPCRCLCCLRATPFVTRVPPRVMRSRTTRGCTSWSQAGTARTAA